MIAFQNHEQHFAEEDQQATNGEEQTALNNKQIESNNRPLRAMENPKEQPSTTTPWPSERSQPWFSERSQLPQASTQSGVGMGTLFFSDDYQSRGTQVLPAYGAIPEQQHEFHYGNPDYNYPDGEPNSRLGACKVSFCEKICCLYRPIVNLLQQEQVRRSFCYGAIDGMLTGSGIASAFCALGVLNVHTKWDIRLAVVAFSAAACFADSLCMAIGHIWTSYVVSSGHAAEREMERELLDDSKGDAKAKLVDMLVARGVLKIDAMSLADTLEGYPDLFVNALVGDSLCAGPDEGEEEQYGVAPPPRTLNSMSAFGSRKFPSYGQFNEIEHDPEQANVKMVVMESQKEGIFMMIGFATFSVIPSLLWLYLPLVIQPVPHTAADREAISPLSMIITITATIMWCLGIWKSYILDSNGIMFGIETVIVLLICIVSAYGVGLLLAYSLGYCLGDSLELLALSK